MGSWIPFWEVERGKCQNQRKKSWRTFPSVCLLSTNICLTKPERDQSEAKCSYKKQLTGKQRTTYNSLPTIPADTSSCGRTVTEGEKLLPELVGNRLCKYGDEKPCFYRHIANNIFFFCSCTETCQAKSLLKQAFSWGEMYIKSTGKSSISKAWCGWQNLGTTDLYKDTRRKGIIMASSSTDPGS